MVALGLELRGIGPSVSTVKNPRFENWSYELARSLLKVFPERKTGKQSVR